jgi:predicted TIM-barrel fold metal-dependent hydrolase
LVDRFPDTTFVLLHAGMPTDRSNEARDQWRRGLAQFAARPNVVVKLSGLGTFVRSCTLQDWRPVITDAIDTFGPHRSMFGSNFPIEKLWTNYHQLLAVFRASLSHLTPAEQHEVLFATATRTYRLTGADLDARHPDPGRPRTIPPANE